MSKEDAGKYITPDYYLLFLIEQLREENKKARYQRIKHVNKDDNVTQNNKNTTEQYIPQIGDIVIITEGEFKGLKGDIVAEVNGYDSYQVKINELNAIYVPKNSVQVIKKKSTEDDIKRLEKEIDDLHKECLKLSDQFNRKKQEFDLKNKELNKLIGGVV